MTKFTFIHVTKSGGTALETYFFEHYNAYITGRGHNEICTNSNNPIIVIRDAKDRFFSMYKYWKNGSEKAEFQRTEQWISQHKNVSIMDFIHMLKNKNEILYHNFTWDQHFCPTTTWISPDMDYKNLIVIKYDKNLNDKAQKLIDFLCIPKHENWVPVPFTNVSKTVNCDHNLNECDECVDAFINEYFKCDIELMEKITKHPELFKAVI